MRSSTRKGVSKHSKNQASDTLSAQIGADRHWCEELWQETWHTTLSLHNRGWTETDVTNAGKTEMWICSSVSSSATNMEAMGKLVQ